MNMSRRTAAIVSGVAVLVMGGYGVASAAGVVAPSALTPGERAQTVEALNRILAADMGNEQVRAAESVVHLSEQEAYFTSCVEKEGWKYFPETPDRPVYVPSLETRLPLITSNSWLLPLDYTDWRMVNGSIEQAKADLAGQKRQSSKQSEELAYLKSLTPSQVDRRLQTLVSCSNAYQRVIEKENAQEVGSGISLQQSVNRAMPRFPRVDLPQLKAEYAPCMKAKIGVRVNDRDATFLYLRGQIEKADKGIAADVRAGTSQNIDAARALEQKVVAADAACRKPVYDLLLNLIGEDLQQDVADHKAELEAREQEQAELVAKARTLAASSNTQL